MANKINCIAVMTSGGDAPGMNAAVRAVVRSALDKKVEVYAIYQGYKGIVKGGEMIRKMNWDSVGGILHKGGTEIGTARCPEFRQREGRLIGAKHLVKRGIDNLVVIGGDGSLTGANLFREEWPSLLKELEKNGEITKEEAKRHPILRIVGLVGSIDNDLSGTDMTIGADTALRRISDALDCISSTAASHQRTFVVEVMGRNCGYLALMSAIGSGADYILIPEMPPEAGKWEEDMCESVAASRKTGKNKSLIIVAEGARDQSGNAITSEYVKNILTERIGEDARVTILGHVQRGGAPSAFDRYMSTVLGHAAIEELINDSANKESIIIGMRKNKVAAIPMMDAVKKTHHIYECIEKGDYEQAVDLRGGSFRDALVTFNTLRQTYPHPPESRSFEPLNIMVMNASGPSPGMNIAVRTAVRVGLDKGHKIFGVRNSFEGLIQGSVHEMTWGEVEEWTSQGGSVLGTNRKTPDYKDFYNIAKTLEKYNINALLIIGGYTGYEGAYNLYQKREEFPAFDIPTVCLPASINNNLPGTDFSVGADSALNNIVDAVDKIKESAVASNRAFVVEVMGRYCGYLALMSGLATGAERVYLHEEGVTLKDLQNDVDNLVNGFREGKRLGLVIRNEYANKIYTTPFISALYEEDGGDVFDVRQSILGHLQQGGNPSPFDRAIGTRLSTKAMEFLCKKAGKQKNESVTIGLQGGHVLYRNIEDLKKVMDLKIKRPKEQWWMELREIAQVFAKNGPKK